jgi:hypothetical protein
MLPSPPPVVAVRDADERVVGVHFADSWETVRFEFDRMAVEWEGQPGRPITADVEETRPSCPA